MATRRFFLTAGAKIVAASGLLGAANATAEVEPTGPITPEEWYAEMRRIGWSAVAGIVWTGSPSEPSNMAQKTLMGGSISTPGVKASLPAIG